MAKSNHRVVYSEFGNSPTSEEDTPLDVPTQQQQVRIQASRSGRKGKTVTIVSGLQLNAENLRSEEHTSELQSQ